MYKDQLLYSVKNVGNRRAIYRSVIGQEALHLLFITPSAPVFAALLSVEDMRQPGYKNLTTTDDFADELPEIIIGKHNRWHLWGVEIYRRHLELNFADKNTHIKHCRALSMRCFMDWPDKLNLTVLSAVSGEVLCNVQFERTAVDNNNLKLSYKKDGLTHIDTYAIRPRSIRPF